MTSKYSPWIISDYTKPYPNTSYNPTLNIILVTEIQPNNMFKVTSVGGGYFGYQLHTMYIPNKYDGTKPLKHIVNYSHEFNAIPVTEDKLIKESIETFLTNVPVKWLKHEQKYSPCDFKELLDRISLELKTEILKQI